MIIKESIGDILTPKSKQEIDGVLSDYSTRELIEILEDHPFVIFKIFERDDYINEMDEDDVNNLLNNCSYYLGYKSPYSEAESKIIKNKLLNVLVKSDNEFFSGFSLSKKDNKYYLNFDWWDDFYIFFHRNSRENIQQILSGEGTNIFNHGGYIDNDFEQLLDFNLQIPEFKKIVINELNDIKNKKYNTTDLLSEIKELDIFNSIFEIIIDNEELFPLIINAIENTINNIQVIADESEAYKDLTRNIQNHLINWKNSGDGLIANISIDEIWVLWRIEFMGESEFNYNEDRWNGDILDFKDDFTDELIDKLGDIKGVLQESTGFEKFLKPKNKNEILDEFNTLNLMGQIRFLKDEILHNNIYQFTNPWYNRNIVSEEHWPLIYKIKHSFDNKKFNKRFKTKSIDIYGDFIYFRIYKNSYASEPYVTLGQTENDDFIEVINPNNKSEILKKIYNYDEFIQWFDDLKYHTLF